MCEKREGKQPRCAGKMRNRALPSISCAFCVSVFRSIPHVIIPTMLPCIKAYLLFAVLAAGMALAGCSPETPIPQAALTPSPSPQPGALTPYLTATASSTPTPPDPATATPLPSPTATLQTHLIKAGEDLGGVAYRFHVSVQALLDANPGLDPYLLKVGSPINIPASSLQPTSAAPSPTPVAVKLKAVNCARTKDGGAWCFVLLRNREQTAVEGVSALVRIADQDGANQRSQVAFAPLDLLPAGATLPLVVYFEPPVPLDLQAAAELLTALPVPDDSDRYLPVQITAQQVHIADGGLSASVSGKLALAAQQGKASAVWVAATAYDADGQVLGVRRWENEKPLRAGQEQTFNLQVYSTGAEISRVDLLAQARP